MELSNLRFTKDHEWIDAERVPARVGITDHAQQELGDIVYVELPEVGRKVRAGEAIGTIESVKAVSEIYCPSGGTVAAVNSALADSPETINRDPYGAGWLVELTPDEPGELSALMTADAYAAFVKS
jgi:glycine cleavage system H protein